MVLPNYTYVKKGDVELPDEKPIISKSIGEKLSIKRQYFHHRKHYVYPLIAPLRAFTH